MNIFTIEATYIVSIQETIRLVDYNNNVSLQQSIIYLLLFVTTWVECRLIKLKKWD